MNIPHFRFIFYLEIFGEIVTPLNFIVWILNVFFFHKTCVLFYFDDTVLKI